MAGSCRRPPFQLSQEIEKSPVFKYRLLIKTKIIFMGTHHRLLSSSQPENRLLFQSCQRSKFSLSCVSSAGRASLTTSGFGDAIEPGEPSGGLRDWRAAARSTDSSLHRQHHIYTQGHSAHHQGHTASCCQSPPDLPPGQPSQKRPLREPVCPIASSQPGPRFALVLPVWGLAWLLLCSWMYGVAAFTAEPTRNIF